MRLSREEDTFLRQWMYDEVHYQEGQGPAKRLQVSRRVLPADLAILIAAAFPDLAEQQAAGESCPPGKLTWPWDEKALELRLVEARELLAKRKSKAVHETLS